MFQLPAYISLLLDACLVVVYFNDPTVLGEDQSKPFENPWDPLRSYLLLAVFAGNNLASLHTHPLRAIR